MQRMRGALVWQVVVGLLPCWISCGSRSEGLAGLEATTAGVLAPLSPLETACAGEPLRLGGTDVLEPAPQLVSTEQGFAAAWATSYGFELRYMEAGDAMASTTLQLGGDAGLGRPFLFWAANELRLYYLMEQSVWLQRFDLRFRETAERQRLVETAYALSVTQLGPERFAVSTTVGLLVDELFDADWYGPQAFGYNGSDYLGSIALGHGEWWLVAIGTEGQRVEPAIDVHWPGANYSLAGGASFASAPSTGLHAIAIASNELLYVAVQGVTVWQDEAVGAEPEAFLLWDSERYVLLLSDGPSNRGGEWDGTARRDLTLHTFAVNDPPSLDEAIDVSTHSDDDSSVVAVATAPGNYRVLWKRGDSMMLTHCRLAADQ